MNSAKSRLCTQAGWLLSSLWALLPTSRGGRGALGQCPPRGLAICGRPGEHPGGLWGILCLARVLGLPLAGWVLEVSGDALSASGCSWH